jgi:pilus assembly protein CpaC
MKKIFLLILLASVAFAVHPGSSYTLDAATDNTEVIKIYMGGFKIMPANGPMRIAIGNPAVADVANVTKQSITLTPKAPGATTLVYWDNFGEQSYKIKVFADNIGELKARVDNLLSKLNTPEVYSQAEEDEGKVLILGRVKTSQDRERVFTVLGALKDKIVDLVQVKEEEALLDIDVQIMELNKDATDTLGFTWPASINFTEVGSPGLAAAGTTWGKIFKVANIMRATDGVATPFTLKLDALIQEGKAQILSRPRVACQSGKEAELIVGGEQPIFTTQLAQTTGAQGTSVEYKEYGIKLKIKPVLTEEKRIKLGVNVEVSEIGTVQSIGSTGGGTTTTTAQAYPLSKRSASTELFLDSGQSMVIGGLIKKKKEETVTRTPFLSNIPLVGAIFRQKVTKVGGGTGQKGDTELFIVLTPTIAAMERDRTQVRKDAPPVVKAEEQPLDPVMQYAKIIQDRILASFIFSPEIKESGYQGTVKLRLHISYTGELLDVAIKEPSGYQLLNDQAVSMAKSVSSYPPFPVAIEEKELWVDVPVTFQLK